MSSTKRIVAIMLVLVTVAAGGCNPLPGRKCRLCHVTVAGATHLN